MGDERWKLRLGPDRVDVAGLRAWRVGLAHQ